MATFTNFATLSYNGGTTNSNVVTGEIVESLTATKTAITENYSAGDNLTHNFGRAQENSWPKRSEILICA